MAESTITAKGQTTVAAQAGEQPSWTSGRRAARIAGAQLLVR
jgi:hypothetical protein